MQLTTEDRHLFRAAARAVNDAQLSIASSSHNYRNALTVAIFVLTGAALLLPGLAAKGDASLVVLRQVTAHPNVATAVPTGAATGAAPVTVPSPPTPATLAPGTGATIAVTTTAGTPSSREVATIELWGVLGALVGAVAGLRNLRGSTQPLGLQLALIALKIPTGALTAVVGVVLLQAALTPTTQPVEDAKLAAVAVIFGAAQEALTAFVDRSAGTLLDKGKTLAEKTTQP